MYLILFLRNVSYNKESENDRVMLWFLLISWQFPGDFYIPQTMQWRTPSRCAPPVLGSWWCIHMYIWIYMYIWGETLFLGTGHQLMTRSWMVCFHISFIKNLMDMYKNFLPLMVTYHPMIYLFEDEGLFPLIIKKLL